MGSFIGTHISRHPGNRPFAGSTGLCRRQDESCAGQACEVARRPESLGDIKPNSRAGQLTSHGLCDLRRPAAAPVAHGDRAAMQYLVALHSPQHRPKMVNTKDVARREAPVDMSARDLTEPWTEGAEPCAGSCVSIS